MGGREIVPIPPYSSRIAREGRVIGIVEALEANKFGGGGKNGAAREEQCGQSAKFFHAVCVVEVLVGI